MRYFYKTFHHSESTATSAWNAMTASGTMNASVFKLQMMTGSDEDAGSNVGLMKSLKQIVREVTQFNLWRFTGESFFRSSVFFLHIWTFQRRLMNPQTEDEGHTLTHWYLLILIPVVVKCPDTTCSNTCPDTRCSNTRPDTCSYRCTCWLTWIIQRSYCKSRWMLTAGAGVCDELPSHEP